MLLTVYCEVIAWPRFLSGSCSACEAHPPKTECSPYTVSNRCIAYFDIHDGLQWHLVSWFKSYIVLVYGAQFY